MSWLVVMSGWLMMSGWVVVIETVVMVVGVVMEGLLGVVVCLCVLVEEGKVGDGG